MAGEVKYTPRHLHFLLQSGLLTTQETNVLQTRLNGASVNATVDQLLPWPDVADIVGISTAKARAKAKQASVRAAKRGLSPDHDWVHEVPDGYKIKGASGYYNAEGKLTGQWVKSTVDPDRQKEIMLERLEEVLSTSRRAFKPTKAPKNSCDDLLNLVTITDFHIGMLAWGAETGADWDTDMAADVFLNAINDMLKVLPKAKVGMLAQLGDFLHFDGIESITPSSGHLLDSDTRYSRLVGITLRIMEEAVALMLKHHEQVIVLQAEGNHDIAGSIWLRKHCAQVWKNEPRVTVDDTEFPYYAHLFGDNLLAFHHGHKTKLKDLPKLFSSEPRYRQMWGNAARTYIHAGHYHHEVLLEDGGAVVRQHPTLASRDAYAARGGWVSEAKAKAIVYHKTDGEIAEYTVRPRP